MTVTYGRRPKAPSFLFVQAGYDRHAAIASTEVLLDRLPMLRPRVFSIEGELESTSF